MIANLHRPSHPLDQFIESFFYYAGYAPAHDVDRFLPDGNVQLIFDLTDQTQYIYDNDTLRPVQSCRSVWFSGFRTVPITIPSGRESEMLIVNFHKGGAFPFLTAPLHALTDQVVDAELVWDGDILGLWAALREAETVERKFALLERALLGQFRDLLVRNPFVDYALSRIIASPGRDSLREIARKVGYSQKHVIKLFKDQVGVTPKEFLKVIRFQRAVEAVEWQAEVSWTAVAHDCGFYDQSHFIADFRSFSGFTPAQYMERRGELINYVPVG